MKKLMIIALALAALTGGGWVANDRIAFDGSAWLADYDQLKTAVEHGYANLQWTRSSKQVDLVALNATALRQLQQATSNSESRRAIQTFIAGFKDGHFHLERKPPRAIDAVLSWFNRERTTPVDFAMGAAEVCSALGFGNKTHELAVSGAAPLPNSTFAAGLLTSGTGKRFGIIRIPLFQQREYGAICERTWPQFRAGRSGQCDENCQDEFNVAVKHEVAQALADDARALMAGGARSVVIDLTGNGGGTEWAEFAAAALTRKQLTPPRVAVIRAISDSARTTCDLRGIWKDRAYQPACWNVVQAQPAAYQGAPFARPFDGKLYIMMNRHTASASEQFAATLRDNNVALTIGERTLGVGCGYINGGNPITLRNSGLVVWMPNCARFRADGTNEFEGVKPDYPADWGSDQTSRRAELLRVLEQLPH